MAIRIDDAHPVTEVLGGRAARGTNGARGRDGGAHEGDEKYLSGKRILVAGGTRGMGRHVADAVIGAGGTAIVPSRSAGRLVTVAREGVPVHRLPRVADIAGEPEVPLRLAGRLDGAVVIIGGFVPTSRMLDASLDHLRHARDRYVDAHLAAARSVLPALAERGGGYLTISGPLAFNPLMFPGSGLVSMNAEQASAARHLMKQLSGSMVRRNEIVIYPRFGWGADELGTESVADIGRYAARFLSDAAAGVHGQTIHIRAPELMDARRARFRSS